jgi:hypothetical protein
MEASARRDGREVVYPRKNFPTEATVTLSADATTVLHWYCHRLTDVAARNRINAQILNEPTQDRAGSFNLLRQLQRVYVDVQRERQSIIMQDLTDSLQSEKRLKNALEKRNSELQSIIDNQTVSDGMASPAATTGTDVTRRLYDEPSALTDRSGLASSLRLDPTSGVATATGSVSAASAPAAIYMAQATPLPSMPNSAKFTKWTRAGLETYITNLVKFVSGQPLVTGVMRPTGFKLMQTDIFATMLEEFALLDESDRIRQAPKVPRALSSITRDIPDPHGEILDQMVALLCRRIWPRKEEMDSAVHANLLDFLRESAHVFPAKHANSQPITGEGHLDRATLSTWQKPIFEGIIDHPGQSKFDGFSADGDLSAYEQGVEYILKTLRAPPMTRRSIN